ncbi:MAG: winged helix-turn-helix transcriptional regulator [Myxococcales bacterium]|nr:winged helix-turn-helix transcriptional regulator [Myxococcales bacterium]
MDKDRTYETRARVFKALGHPSRLKIVDALQAGPKNVAELVALVGHEYATVSRHISQLKEAGIVSEDRKEGSMVFYRLEVTCIAGFFSCVTQVVEQRREALRLS